MLFTVRHATTYLYSAPVRLGRHRLRLSPRPTAGRFLSRRLEIWPEPVGLADEIDAFGNLTTVVDFAGETDRLTVESRFEVETTARTPPAAVDVAPLPWPADDDPAIRRDGTGPDDPVRAFAEAIAQAAGGHVDTFLDRLNATLFERTHHHIRGGGSAQPPEVTLATARGACRDTAVLFIDAARSLGIPARFVSGYQARAETADGGRHLHAWPEVLIPGVGWRGYDPTHGLAVEDGHVALAAAPDQADTMPIEGGFWGDDGVRSRLDYVVEIEAEG